MTSLKSSIRSHFVQSQIEMHFFVNKDILNVNICDIVFGLDGDDEVMCTKEHVSLPSLISVIRKKIDPNQQNDFFIDHYGIRTAKPL